MMLKSGGGHEYEVEKRVETIEGLVGKALFILIWIVAGLMVLKELNFDVRPCWPGAGVAAWPSVSARRTSSKTSWAGMFLMMENQIRVNDVAVINGKRAWWKRSIFAPPCCAAKMARCIFSPTESFRACRTLRANIRTTSSTFLLRTPKIPTTWFRCLKVSPKS